MKNRDKKWAGSEFFVFLLTEEIMGSSFVKKKLFSFILELISQVLYVFHPKLERMMLLSFGNCG